MRNSVAKSDLPHPAAPQTSVGRPWGKPPPVISSNPPIPVGTFFSTLDDRAAFPFPCDIGLTLPNFAESQAKTFNFQKISPQP